MKLINPTLKDEFGRKINLKSLKTNNLSQFRLSCQTCNLGYMTETTYKK